MTVYVCPRAPPDMANQLVGRFQDMSIREPYVSVIEEMRAKIQMLEARVQQGSDVVSADHARLQVLESRLQHVSVVLSTWGLQGPLKCDALHLSPPPHVWHGERRFYHEAFNVIDVREVIIRDDMLPLLEWKIENFYARKIVFNMVSVRSDLGTLAQHQIFAFKSLDEFMRKIRRPPENGRFVAPHIIADQVEVVEIHSPATRRPSCNICQARPAAARNTRLSGAGAKRRGPGSASSLPWLTARLTARVRPLRSETGSAGTLIYRIKIVCFVGVFIMLLQERLPVAR